MKSPTTTLTTIIAALAISAVMVLACSSTDSNETTEQQRPCRTAHRHHPDEQLAGTSGRPANQGGEPKDRIKDLQRPAQHRQYWA